MVTLRLRPHHMLCSLSFRGKGYSNEFVKNFKAIHKKLKSEHTTIKIINCCDDICEKCPEKQGDLCNKHQIVAEIDDAYLRILQLHIGQTITFKHLETRIKKLLTIGDFKKTCSKCSWYPLNICTPIVRDLLENK